MNLFVLSLFLLEAVVVTKADSPGASDFFSRLGTEAPPSAVGQDLSIPIVPFAADERPILPGENLVDTVPTGLLAGADEITFSVLPGREGTDFFLDHVRIGNGWNAWSHEYAGDVYINTFRNLHFSLPSRPKAFVFYLGVEDDVICPFFIEYNEEYVKQEIRPSDGAIGFAIFDPGGIRSEIIISGHSNDRWAVGSFYIEFTNSAPVAKCHTEVIVPSPGNCAPAMASIDNGSDDPDTDQEIEVSQSPEGPYPIGETEVELTISDGSLSASCTSTVIVHDVDSDGDGILDCDDNCPDTVIPESVPTKKLGTNRWALTTSDGDFETTLPGGAAYQLGYSIADTHGCSCEQIIGICGYGKGHEKRGCSNGAMEAFSMDPPQCDGLVDAFGSDCSPVRRRLRR